MSIPNLPDIEFVSTDVGLVKQSIISEYEGLTGLKLYPGDPVRLFLESLAAVIAQQRSMIDSSAKTNLLVYARGDFLDHLGALTNTTRLPAQKALTTLRFSIDAGLEGIDVVIPIGTRATPDGILFYATLSEGTIYQIQDIVAEEKTFSVDNEINLDHGGLTGDPIVKDQAETVTYVKDTDYTVDLLTGLITRIVSGSIPPLAVMHIDYSYAVLTVDVEAECTTAGIAGTGFVPGQINQIVDPVGYVTGVSNTVISAGGVDIEKDEPYIERIQLAPERFSSAGPTGAYIFHAKSAHQSILDVSVYTVVAGTVEVRVLMIGGTLPSAEILTLVDDALSPEDVRPLSDTVNVAAPTQIPYNIDVTYYIHQDQSALVNQIQAAVITAKDNFISWQKSKIGRDINPSMLISMLLNAGAKRVVVTSPAFQSLDVFEVANDGTVTLTYGGLEIE
jgi:phage-related baseplate assembly protein